MKTQTFACSAHAGMIPNGTKRISASYWVLYISGLHQIQLK